MIRCHIVAIGLVGVLACAAGAAEKSEAKAGPKPGEPWIGVHVSLGSDRAAAALEEQAPKLAKLGVNVLIVEVNYGLKFKSHPELAGNLSYEGPLAVNIELPQDCINHLIRQLLIFIA